MVVLMSSHVDSENKATKRHMYVSIALLYLQEDNTVRPSTVDNAKSHGMLH